jgi:hypothetical protein
VLGVFRRTTVVYIQKSGFEIQIDESITKAHYRIGSQAQILDFVIFACNLTEGEGAL